MKRQKLTAEWKQQQYDDPEWQKVRLKVLHRDNFESQLSYTKGNIHSLVVHHMKYLWHEDGTPYSYAEYADHTDCLLTVTKEEHAEMHGFNNIVKESDENYVLTKDDIESIIVDYKVLFELYFDCDIMKYGLEYINTDNWFYQAFNLMFSNFCKLHGSIGDHSYIKMPRGDYFNNLKNRKIREYNLCKKTNDTKL